MRLEAAGGAIHMGPDGHGSVMGSAVASGMHEWNFTILHSKNNYGWKMFVGVADASAGDDIIPNGAAWAFLVFNGDLVLLSNAREAGGAVEGGKLVPGGLKGAARGGTIGMRVDLDSEDRSLDFNVNGGEWNVARTRDGTPIELPAHVAPWMYTYWGGDGVKATKAVLDDDGHSTGGSGMSQASGGPPKRDEL